MNRRLIRPVLALASGLLVACSSGESGLILSRIAPPDEAQGGGAGTPSNPTGGSGGTGSPWYVQACSPAVVFENRDLAGDGSLFAEAVPDPTDLIHGVTHNACSILYRESNEVRSVSQIRLIVELRDGIAASTGTSVFLSSTYLRSVEQRGDDLLAEITGVLHFSISLMYLHDGDDSAPGWLRTGTADFVRLRSGYLSRSSANAGGSWQEGYQRTAFFLDWIDSRESDFVYRMNRRLAPGEPPWNEALFSELAGADLQTLWDEYQGSF